MARLTPMTTPQPNRAAPVIAVGPHPDPRVDHAIRRGGGVPGPLARAQGLMWVDPRGVFPGELPESLTWVQLPFAGVERWLESGVLERHPQVTFTSAAGVYAGTVAEHAAAMLLAGTRGLWRREPHWDPERAGAHTRRLAGSTVAVVGAGGIGRALIPILHALGTKVIAVNRSGAEVPGAQVYPADRLAQVWPQADHVVVAAPATARTRALIDAEVLAQLRPHSWIINVARGALIDTDALLVALRAGTVGGAGLDVSDPEPLPDGHPLWRVPNAIITPHVANPPGDLMTALLERIEVNVRRVANFMPPLAAIEAERGY